MSAPSAPSAPSALSAPGFRRCMRSRGFTLVELLVALLITAIMFAIGYGELNQSLKSRRELDEQSARLLAIQKAIRTMEQDFELMQPRPVRNQLGDGYLPALTTTPLTANGTTLLSGSSNPALSTAVPLVSFTRGGWTNPVGLQRSELQRVSYAISNGALIRQYTPVLDATLDDPVISRTLLDHVQSFSLRFMDAGHNWQTQWPVPNVAGAGANPAIAGSAQDPTLRYRPIAVEITLQLADWGLIVRDVEVGS